MSLTHVHLFLNHVPILGILFAAVLFAIALARGSVAFQRVVLALIVVFAVAAIPVYLTGEAAEGTVEHAAGVSKTVIERHQRAELGGTLAATGGGGEPAAGAAHDDD